MKWITTKVLGWALVVAVLAGIAGVGAQQMRVLHLQAELAGAHEGQSRIEARLSDERRGWEAERRKQAEDHAGEQKMARETERLMQQAADKFKNDAYAQINRLTRARDAALDELHSRPQRPVAPTGPDGLPQVSGTPAGCTGAGLYRPDAEFLVRFAAASAQLAVERDSCYQQHPGAPPK